MILVGFWTQVISYKLNIIEENVLETLRNNLSLGFWTQDYDPNCALLRKMYQDVLVVLLETLKNGLGTVGLWTYAISSELNIIEENVLGHAGCLVRNSGK